MFVLLETFQEQHVKLETLFTEHQLALMALDMETASLRLNEFSSLLESHMAVEEELLIPLFLEHCGEPDRLGPKLLRLEHEKLLRLLESIWETLEEHARRDAVTHRDVLDLFDRELSFKRSLHHHDMRERGGLFPMLGEALGDGDQRAEVEARLKLQLS